MDYSERMLVLVNAFGETGLEPAHGTAPAEKPGSEHERLAGLYLSAGVPVRAEFERGSAKCAIRIAVSDERPERLAVVAGLQFWEGRSSLWPNPLANHVLRAVIDAIAVGDMAFSDPDWERAKEGKRRPWAVPVLRGPCLVTGADGQGRPGPFPEAFRSWWRDNGLRIVERAAEWRLETPAFDELQQHGGRS